MAGVNPALTQSLLDHILDLKDAGHDGRCSSSTTCTWCATSPTGSIVMAEGKIVAEGDPTTVMNDPAVIDAYLGAHQDARPRRRHRPHRRSSRPIRRRMPRRPPRQTPPHSSTRASPRSRTGGPQRPTAATATGTPRRRRVDEVHAGYLPGRQHPQRLQPRRASRASSIGIIGPNGAGKSTLLKAIFGQVNVRERLDHRSNGEDITGLRANKLVGTRRRLRPAERTTSSPASPIEENLQMGLYQQPKRLQGAPRVRHGHLLRAGQAPQAARRLAVGRRAADGGDEPRAHDGPAACCCSTSRRPASPRSGRTRRSSASPRSTRPASPAIMVEQNARRCLQICDRGYVLDQGRDAYTGHRARAAERPQGHRAVPGHARQVAPADLSTGDGCRGIRPRLYLSPRRPVRRRAARPPVAPQVPATPNGPGSRTRGRFASRTISLRRPCTCCRRRTGRYRSTPRSGRRPRRT